MLGLNLPWYRRNAARRTGLARCATRLLNRNGLEDVRSAATSVARSRPVTLLQIDIDHFKRVNDNHGHAVGDAVRAPEIAAAIVGCAGERLHRRTGGEEFPGQLRGGRRRRGLALAERLLAAVRRLDIRVPG